MMIRVTECHVDQAATALTLIPELGEETAASLAARIADKPALLLIAYCHDEIAGVKLGYAENSTTFYSWLGGVAPDHRGKGVAQLLLEVQEKWVVEQGYQALTVKSQNRYPAMLRLLLRNGYVITHCEVKERVEFNRIYFSKSII
ncbi:GNAT family N-acetyltransferase [Thaumasiovibrio subtropicus]|uniref:GNAT family N-acetyltransferase n=1 Tax=Thaumasiovibrio subtropicus TaxID=1891207 RepID=UPI000B363484|nr:GNAT family N-acetyltransferase [Thaumasiovibrio subtropicus]